MTNMQLCLWSMQMAIEASDLTRAIAVAQLVSFSDLNIEKFMRADRHNGYTRARPMPWLSALPDSVLQKALEIKRPKRRRAVVHFPGVPFDAPATWPASDAAPC